VSTRIASLSVSPVTRTSEIARICGVQEFSVNRPNAGSTRRYNPAVVLFPRFSPPESR